MTNLLDELLEFEQKEKLFEQTIHGIYFWSLVRKRVFDQMQIDLKLIQPLDYTVSDSTKKNMISILKYIGRAALNKLKPFPKIDICILNHPRKVIQNNEYMDIYTHDLIQTFLKEKQKFLVFDIPLNWDRHLISKKEYIRNIENFSIIKKVYYKYFAKNNFTKNPVLLELSHKLKQQFQTDGNLIDQVFEQIHLFQIDYHYYKKLFKKLKVKKVYVVIYYVHLGMIKAAQELGIEVYEVQHGIHTKQHLGYHFPNQKQVPYFPDYFLLYGKFWYDSVSMPINLDHIIYMENRFLTQYDPKDLTKKENRVTFLGQAAVTSNMIPYVKELCNQNKDKYEIIFKLHPSEYEVWKKLYPDLLQLQEQKKIIIIDHFEKSLYDFLYESNWAIGVSSTALYEALYFQNKIILLDISTVETMQYLLESNLASIAHNPSQLPSLLEENRSDCEKIDTNYIYYQKGE